MAYDHYVRPTYMDMTWYEIVLYVLLTAVGIYARTTIPNFKVWMIIPFIVGVMAIRTSCVLYRKSKLKKTEPHNKK